MDIFVFCIFKAKENAKPPLSKTTPAPVVNTDIYKQRTAVTLPDPPTPLAPRQQKQQQQKTQPQQKKVQVVMHLHL